MMNTDEHGLKKTPACRQAGMHTDIVIIVLLILFLSTRPVFAQPNITGIDKIAITHKESVNISGSAFGRKENATPAIWDAFEWGNDGDLISTGGWIKYKKSAEIDTVRKYGPGTRSAYANLTLEGGWENAWKSCYKTFGPSLTAYVSFMVYWSPSGPTGGGWKASRVNSVEVYSGVPAFEVAAQPDWYYAGVYSGGDGFNGDINPINPDGWHRVEYLMILSDPPGATNGYANIWIDLRYNPEPDWRGLAWPYKGVTRAAGNTNQLNIFLGPHMWANLPNPIDVWMDDVYVDVTQARIELGDKSTFSSCTHREIQLPVAWSDNSITFTANQGSFQDGDPVYLYVVDENGNVNEQGYPVTFGLSGLLGDVNSDGKVDIKDLILVAKDFGKTSGFNPGCDLNGDAKIDIKDLIIVAKNFGKSQ